MNWIRVEDGMPQMPPHSQDGATERVLVWVEKDYYPHVYTARYEYTEDGSDWEVDGLHYLRQEDWKVTHWMKEPNRPENGQPDPRDYGGIGHTRYITKEEAADYMKRFPRGISEGEQDVFGTNHKGDAVWPFGGQR